MIELVPLVLAVLCGLAINKLAPRCFSCQAPRSSSSAS